MSKEEFDKNCDILSAMGIRPFLSTKEAKITVYEHLESTNTTAKQLASSGTEHGTIIIADHQTAGRGRYNRSFFSPPGNGIYISFILRPTRRNCTPALLTMYAAVAVCEAIEVTTGKTPKIKWVNDIFLNERKICGILTEASTDFENGGVHWAVIGTGINFSTPSTGFPKDLENIAGSIFSDCKPTTTRNQLVAEVTNRILNFDAACFSDDIVIDKYRKRLMMLGKRVIVTGLEEPFEATAIDVDGSGHLIVKKDSGEVLSLSAGEVTLKVM